jgi:hypothetical protein
MSAMIRYAAFGVAIILLGAGGFALSRMKPDPDRQVFLGVDGDPRMRLCDGPANAKLASPPVIAALGLQAPLVKAEGLTAAYRLSVIRPAGQQSLSVSFVTPESGDSRLRLTVSDGGPATTRDVPMNFARAADLVYALEAAGIWGKMQPTIETLVRAGEASAVIEVRAPKHDRCVTTRYDDERVRPLFAAFAKRIAEADPAIDASGLVAPELSFIPGRAPAAPAAN